MPQRTSSGVSRRSQVAVAAAVFVALVAAAPFARATLSEAAPPSTLLPPLTPPSTEPAPPPSTDTTSTTAPADTTSTSLLGGDGTQDDQGLSPLGGGPGQVIPDAAAAYIASLPRSAPNDDRALVEGEQALVAAGYDRDQAARLAYGRFPVAGLAHWSDDWLDPRFSGTEFRYHYGIDVIAPYGTPLRSPDDGVIGVEEREEGGLTVKVILPDSTFYELAHMSATAPGIQPGVTVRTGDLLGYVGATGDATGPHLHLGLWVGGATPTSTKPLLDQWAADAAAGLRRLLDPQRARSLLGTILTREVTEGTSTAAAPPTGAAPTDILLASAGNPAGGALQVAKAAASELAGSVDWNRRADEGRAARQAWAASTARAWFYLGPLTPAALRPLLAPSAGPS